MSRGHRPTRRESKAQPLERRATVRSRVITSPKHAKRLLSPLSENVARYEHVWGAIDTHNKKQLY